MIDASSSADAVAMRFVLLFLAFSAFVSCALAQTNRAFVVGIGDYAELTDLNKTIGDANGYADVFRDDLDFEVTRLLNPGLEDFLAAFGKFTSTIEEGDQIAFVFSGHGWSDGGQNYLAMSDAPLQSTEFILKRMTVALQRDVLDELTERKPGLVLAIIDACRDNPFDLGTKSVTKGLVPQQTVPGTLVVYAAGAQQKALDRLRPNDPSPYSVFTRNLLPKLRDPSAPLMRIIDETRTETANLAQTISHAQRPAIYSDVSLDFCLGGSCSAATSVRLLSDASLVERLEARSPEAVLAWSSGDGGVQLFEMAARLLNSTTPSNQEQETGALFAEASCEMGNVRACVGFSRLLAGGIGVARNSSKALELMDRACTFEDAEGCFYSGMWRAEMSEQQKISQEIVQFWYQSCSLDFGEACFRVGLVTAATRAGNSVPAIEYGGEQVMLTQEDTRRFIDKACLLGSSSGCDFIHRGRDIFAPQSTNFDLVFDLEDLCEDGSNAACLIAALRKLELKHGVLVDYESSGFRVSYAEIDITEPISTIKRLCDGAVLMEACQILQKSANKQENLDRLVWLSGAEEAKYRSIDYREKFQAQTDWFK